MRMPAAVLMAAFASGVVAADPPAPIEVETGWEGPAYKVVTNRFGTKESWHYGAGGATLLITRSKCSPCKPIGTHDIEAMKVWPNDVAALVQVGRYPAKLSFSLEPLEHHITSIKLTSDQFHYRLQLTAVSSISARESMRLQQQLLRMASDWQPE